MEGLLILAASWSDCRGTFSMWHITPPDVDGDGGRRSFFMFYRLMSVFFVRFFEVAKHGHVMCHVECS